MSRIIFEHSPLYLLLCLLFGIGLSYLLYKGKHPWTNKVNKLLFACRFVLIFILCFLLLGPIVRQIKNYFIEPVFVVLQDDSQSIREVMDSTQLQDVEKRVQDLKQSLETKGYQVALRKLADAKGASDFTSAFRKIGADYEGQKLEGVVFISDGIYNAGLSPLYTTFNFPIHSVGIGDTSERLDFSVKNITYNKIAYQGNRFPIRVDIKAPGFLTKNVEVSLFNRGKLIEKQSVRIANEAQTQIQFLPLAEEQGLQRYEIVIAPQKEEWNVSNNRSAVFLEVVSGKKKILAVAAAPHPDIKALRSVIEQNANYDFNLYIPGVGQNDASALISEADLILLFQVPDARGRTKSLLQRILSSKASLFFILGEQSDWQELSKQGLLALESMPRQYDDVTPSFNTAFSTFTFDERTTTVFQSFPPASVPFVKIQIPVSATPLLFQRVGSVSTDKPLLFVEAQDDRKVAFMVGEGLWRWRLHEFNRNENTEAFDDIFSKLIQYLATTDDRRKFKSYPVKQEFLDTETVQFESQVYNDIYEPVFGKSIEIELINEAGLRTSYRYTTSEANSRYTIGNLSEGVYRYKASTGAKENEEVRGEFLVTRQQAELQNLTADFSLLRKLSNQTGGNFVIVSGFDGLKQKLLEKEAVAKIQTEEKFDSLINLKWIFLLLLLLISIEWFLRKYLGSY